jgi:SlyX protein
VVTELPIERQVGTTEIIESKIAFLEQTTSELSDVIVRQQQELRALERKVAQLSEQLEALKEAPLSSDSEKPPHY